MEWFQGNSQACRNSHSQISQIKKPDRRSCSWLCLIPVDVTELKCTLSYWCFFINLVIFHWEPLFLMLIKMIKLTLQIQIIRLYFKVLPVNPMNYTVKITMLTGYKLNGSKTKFLIYQGFWFIEMLHCICPGYLGVMEQKVVLLMFVYIWGVSGKVDHAELRGEHPKPEHIGKYIIREERDIKY